MASTNSETLWHRIRSLCLCLLLIAPQHATAQGANNASAMAQALRNESFQLPDYLDAGFRETASRYLELAGQIDNGYAILLENCYEDPIPLNRAELCDGTARNILAAEAEMEDDLMPSVRRSLFGEGEICGASQTGVRVDTLGDVARDASEAMFRQCMALSPSGPRNCGKEIACSITSTLSLAGLWRAGSSSTDRECLSSENDCFTQFMASLSSVFVASVSGMWSLLRAAPGWAWDTAKAAPGWAWDKGGQFWNRIAGVEDATSEKQELIANLPDRGIGDIDRDPEGWTAKMLGGIAATLGEVFKRTVFCEEWEDDPMVSECRKPLRSWWCLDCGAMLNGICVLGGGAGGLIAQIFATGVVFGAVAKTVQAANTGFNYGATAARAGIEAMQSSPRYAALVEQIAKTPYAQAVGNLSKEIGGGSSAFNMASQSLRHMKTTMIDVGQKIGHSDPVISAHNTLIRLSNSPIGQGGRSLVDAQEKVFMSGFDLVAGGTGGNSTIGALVNMAPDGLLSAAGSARNVGNPGAANLAGRTGAGANLAGRTGSGANLAGRTGSGANLAGRTGAGANLAGRTGAGAGATGSGGGSALKASIDGTDDNGRIENVERRTGTALSERQRAVLAEALRIGTGEIGADGINPAATGNYTYGQKLRKFKKLVDDDVFDLRQSRIILDGASAGDGYGHGEERPPYGSRPKTLWDDLWQVHAADGYHWLFAPGEQPAD